MKQAQLGGSVTILLPERFDPNKKDFLPSNSSNMNPKNETPESHSNGITPNTKPPGSALKSRARPKKAPELQTIERRNWLIHLEFVRRNFGKCKEIIKEQLRETRGMCEYANYVQGLIHRQEGRIQESFELFQLCNILNPNSVENIKQMARSLFLLGRHKLAIEAYTQAEAKAEKPDWEVHHNLGMCYLHLRDFSKAKEQLTLALDHNKHPMTFTTLAKIYQVENDIPASIASYRAAVEHFPENPELHTNVGLLYMQTGSYQQAFEHLGTALTFDSKNTKAILAAGSMMQSHQDFDVALSKYRVAAQSIPESPSLWNNIAMCFFGKKKYVAAISCLKRANYLAPFDWKILYNLGLVHLTMQQYASAFHFLSAAVNLRPTKGHIFMLLAVTLTYLEDDENAKQAYEQAMKLEPKDPNVCLNFAIFHHNRNENSEATKRYNDFEMRMVKLRQSTGSDLESEILEAGSRLARTLGISTSVFAKKPSKNRLEASFDNLANDGPPSSKNKEVDPNTPSAPDISESPSEDKSSEDAALSKVGDEASRYENANEDYTQKEFSSQEQREQNILPELSTENEESTKDYPSDEDLV